MLTHSRPHLPYNTTHFHHPKLPTSLQSNRILNPTDADLRGYWWTCVAVDAEPSTRIYTPATHVAETSRDPMREVRIRARVCECGVERVWFGVYFCELLKTYF